MRHYFSIFLLLAGQVLAQITPDDFIADFESGNIANVQQVGADSFTIEIRLDDNHGDTYGWYYFAIVNNQGRSATMFLTNPDSWENSGCSPLTSADNISWGRVQNVWGQNGWLCFRQFLPNDTVWFAQGYPFTVTKMYSYLDSVQSSPYSERVTLGYSTHNRPIDMITITDETVPLARRKTAWLISRQHPMESGPTYLITGLIDRVLDESVFSRYFLRDINLKIVPIVNVDGVAEGYSRHNVNGINLNRDWRPDMDIEQPSVQAVHAAIDGYLSWGNSIDLFMDLHAAPDNYDFGFRMSESYTDEDYHANQGTFLHYLETFDQWQEDSRWRDLDTSYANGVSCVVLYHMYEIDALTTENPWTRRDNVEFITSQTMYQQGPSLAATIYDYLYPLTVYDEDENRIDSIVPGNAIFPVVHDYDQRNQGSVEATALCYASGDSEQVILYREDFEGIFVPLDPIPTNIGQGVPGDGILSVLTGAELVVRYTEPEIPDRTCERYLAVDYGLEIVGDRQAIPLSDMTAHPNPFNARTTISYSNVSGAGLSIYDVMGRIVRSFPVDDRNNGKIVWDATSEDGGKVSTGIYFVVDRGRSSGLKLLYLK